MGAETASKARACRQMLAYTYTLHGREGVGTVVFEPQKDIVSRMRPVDYLYCEDMRIRRKPSFFPFRLESNASFVDSFQRHLLIRRSSPARNVRRPERRKSERGCEVCT